MSHFWYTKGGVIYRQHRRRSKDFGEYGPKSKDFGVLVVRVWRKNRRILFVFCAHRGGFWGVSLVITKLLV